MHTRSQSLIPMVRDRLAVGEVAIIPTPLSYIFILDGRNAEAASRVLSLKGVRADSGITPLGLLTHRDQADRWGQMTAAADELMTLWPAPISLMVTKSHRLPDWITPYQSVALACPDSFCAELAAALPFPIACVGANPSGEFLVTRYSHAAQLYQGQVNLILDGGTCPLAMASTMVDCSIDPPVLARYGPVTMEQLRQIIPDLQAVSHLMK
ncbi:MAG: hypothetical protein OHK0012_24650 [Synechococcales cyanobacterium]